MDLIATFIFYSKSSGPQAKLAFNDDFRHCNTITYDGSDWILLDFDKTGLLTRRIKCPDGASLIRNLHKIKDITAVVTVNINKRHPVSWKPFWVRSCNEVCRYASGIALGLTFNPIHLYRKLLKYRHKRNYKIIAHWRRKQHGILRWRQ